jgi:glycosyltransferase involved in cell wall biosynthesis
MSLHVCYISQEYPPETGWGGIGSYTYEMAHALANEGHRVTVISRAVDQESVVDDAGVVIHRVAPKPNWDPIPIAWRMNRIWPGFAWAAMRKLRQIHRSNPIDIVEAAEGRADGFFVSYLPHRPKLVTRLHTARIFIDRFNDVHGKQSGARDYWFEKQQICRANLVTAPSQAVVDLTQTWLGSKAQHAIVVPNPINKVRFAPNGSRRQDIVLYVGRLEQNKGVATMMQAIPVLLERFPTLEFRFIGSDGCDRNGASWRQKILDAVDPASKSRVRFEQMSRPELARAYQEAAVCILPSRWENSSYVLLEAMACGTPVVAGNNGGSPELVEDGVNGFLIPVNSVEALAARVSDLMSQPGLRQAMGENARRKIEQAFSVEQILPRMIAAYDYALAN